MAYDDDYEDFMQTNVSKDDKGKKVGSNWSEDCALHGLMMTEGSKEEYQKFFNSAMKKFKINSPADLKSDEDKKKFYDYVDKNWTGDHEEAFEFAKESKVSSIIDIVKNMWQVDENVKKEDDDKEIKGDKTLTGKKSASVDVDPDIEEKHKKKVHASKAY